jgi:hypothetical protein
MLNIPSMGETVVLETGFEILKPNPLHEFVRLLANMINQTGKRMKEIECPSLATFIIRELKTNCRKEVSGKDRPSTDLLIEQLIKVFPCFQDVAKLSSGQGTNAYLLLYEAVLVRRMEII